MIENAHYLTITHASELIRSAKLSSVELTRAYLRRIDSLNPRIHAFITVLPDLAMRAAEQADREISEGTYRGPLHGIPIAHKDILWTKGIRTTAHSKLLQSWVPQESATVVNMLEACGAVCVGKAALHEFAYGSPGPDEAFPAVRNPWHLDYAPGSSSSGSAAAVAAGLCMAATGTDTGGSVRHPASVCGIVGMKGTYGLVSNYGVIPLAPSLDHVGPLTRNVRDNAVMFQAMVGHDPKDPSSIAVNAPNVGRCIGKNIKQIRVGVPRRFIEAHAHAEEVVSAFEKALSTLGDLGARVEEIDPPGLDDCIDAVNTIIGFEARCYHRENLEKHPELLGNAFKGRFNRVYSEDDYKTALATGRKLKSVYQDLFKTKIDVVVSPGKEVPADLMSDLLVSPSRRPVSNRIYSLTGLPALTMPMALSAAGIPMGIQIAANYLREETIYQVAAAFEEAIGLTHLHPPIDK